MWIFLRTGVQASNFIARLYLMLLFWNIQQRINSFFLRDICKLDSNNPPSFWEIMNDTLDSRKGS